MGVTSLVLLGPVGTRWLFAIIVASALFAWGSETAMGVIEPSDRIAYPLIAVTFAALALLVLILGVVTLVRWKRGERHLLKWSPHLLVLLLSQLIMQFQQHFLKDSIAFTV